MRLDSSAHRLSSPKWWAIFLVALVEALALSVWFAGSAIVPQLIDQWDLSSAEQSWMTMSVQLGFVAGALVSAVVNLADRVALDRLLGFSAIGAALATAAITLAPGPGSVIFGRLIVGVFLAGVYPPGMKLVATWTLRDRGFALGILVGALTVGSALPHLLNAVPVGGFSGMPPWRPVLWMTAGSAGLAGLLSLTFLHEGPHLTTRAPFDWRVARRALSEAPIRYANLGYLGHMWELYAMWTWAPIFLLASFDAAGWNLIAARLAGFATIAIGGLGCIVAGRLADRLGRTRVASWSLVVSGTCCLLVGGLFAHPGALTAVCLLWGFAVVADSAQFSAAVSELADERYVGTLLTLQTCMGFLLTLISIRLVPIAVEVMTWRFVFLLLVPGPLIGLWSMHRLRRRSEARRLASGRG